MNMWQSRFLSLSIEEKKHSDDIFRFFSLCCLKGKHSWAICYHHLCCLILLSSLCEGKDLEIFQSL